MKIAIIGAGAMGCIYATYLSRHNDVLLVDGVKAHVDAINENGLVFEHLDGSVETYKNLRATFDTTNEKPADLVILLTKGYQSAEALEKNKALIGGDTTVLSLQNGYGNADEIAKYVPEDQIVLGTSGGGAIVAGPGHVLHRGQGATHIGGLGKDQSRAETVKRVMDEGGVPEVELVPNVLELVWSKLFVNIGINAICALTDSLNKTVVHNEFAHRASYALVKEAVEVANAVGMSFDLEKEFKNVMDIATVTGENVCSMLADVRNKRRTEVDRINGAAVSEGAKVGMAAPFNEFITNLIHAKELLY